MSDSGRTLTYISIPFECDYISHSFILTKIAEGDYDQDGFHKKTIHIQKKTQFYEVGMNFLGEKREKIPEC
jgi:hypothetical protein